MPRLAIAGHIVLDTIVLKDRTVTSLGGPPCYAGLQARALGADVTVVTKVGYDLSDQHLMWLAKNQLNLHGLARSRTKPTTRFRIVQRRGPRELFLLSRCERIPRSLLNSLTADGIILSPVAGELSVAFVREAAKRFRTVYLDPQGFLRTFNATGRCRLQPFPRPILQYANVVKVDLEEARALTGRTSLLDALRAIQSRGPRVVAGTRGRRGILLLYDGSAYHIPVQEASVVDTTGAGDIFAGAFMAAFLSERDPLWAACVGAAASSRSTRYAALSKIQPREEIFETAQRLRGATQGIV